jgi:hypothetical protein
MNYSMLHRRSYRLCDVLDLASIQFRLILLSLAIFPTSAFADFTWQGIGHSYVDIGFTHYSACQAAANNLSGNIVVVNDAAENAMLQSNITWTLEFWLGYTDVATEGTWVWVCGSPGYTNWRSGEPNNSSDEDYGVFVRWSSGTWNDFDNVSPNGSIGCVIEIGNCSDTSYTPTPTPTRTSTPTHTPTNTPTPTRTPTPTPTPECSYYEIDGVTVCF